MKIEVQKIKNDWNIIPGGLTWFMIGQPKSGKSTAASKWSEKGSDGVLILDTDLGADFVEDANVLPIVSLGVPKRPKLQNGKEIMKDGRLVEEVIPPNERGYNFRTGKNKGKPMSVYSLAEALSWLRNNWDKTGYDTIVLDTVTEVNKWIEEIVKSELEIRVMGEGEWGTDWGMARRKNLDIIVRLQKFMKKVGGNLILIGHSKMTSMVDGKAQLSPELPGGLTRALTAKADVIGYVTGDKATDEYTISFKSYDERTIGSRLEPLAQKELPLDYKAVVNEMKKYEKEKKEVKSK